MAKRRGYRLPSAGQLTTNPAPSTAHRGLPAHGCRISSPFARSVAREYEDPHVAPWEQLVEADTHLT